MTEKLINQSDRDRLRSLAAQVAQIAQLPQQAKKKQLWLKQHRLEQTRPVFMCCPEHAWRELIPAEEIQGSSPLARTYEWSLRHLIYRHEHIHDDYVIEATLDVPYVNTTSGWGLDLDTERPGPEQQLHPDFAYNDLSLIRILGEFRNLFGQDCRHAKKSIPPLIEPDQLNLLTYPTIAVDTKQTQANFTTLQEILGDILTVRLSPYFFVNNSLIGTLNVLRGMEQVMFDMIDRPQWVHQAMRFLVNGAKERMRFLIENNYLTLNNSNQWLDGGGQSYSDQLPGPDFDNNNITFQNLWGHATIQSGCHLSGAMQEEFIFSYQRKLLQAYGLVCYGCCEPIRPDNIQSILAMPNLRRLIVSPWSDLNTVTESLQTNVVLAWKPNPAQISPAYDLDASRKELRTVLDQTKHNLTQIILKDIHTVDNHPERIDHYTQMVHETVNNS